MITPSFGLTATERVLPKLALDFTTASLDNRITFTRTTGASNPATYVNSSGYVTAATNNQPRFDFDPVTLACKGLLIEESRTNFLKYSEDFTQGVWSKVGATISANTITAPDGNTTADKLVEDTSTGSHRILATGTNGISLTSGLIYTISFFVKNAGRDYAFIRLNNAGGDLVSGNVRISDATVTQTSAGTIIATAYPNGWVRIVGTGTSASTSVGYGELRASNSATYASYTGDGTSGIYIWGAQLEAGAFATSYIPTTTTALTRNADVATMTGTNFSDWYNPTAGSFVLTYDFVGAGPSGGFMLGANTAHRPIYTPANPRTFDGTTVVNSGVSPATGSTNTVCSTYGATTATIACNGNATISGSYNGIAATTTAIQFMTNYGSSNNYTNGHLYKLFYYPQQLTSAEVRSFSKG